MWRKALPVLVLVLHTLFPGMGSAQTSLPSPSQVSPAWQRLLLQLATNFHTISTALQVDLDSSLIVVARSLGISRGLIIGEGIGNDKVLANTDWIDGRQPSIGRLRLASLKGKAHLQQLLLLGAYYAFEPDNYHRARDSVIYFLNAAQQESRALNEPNLGRTALCLLGKMYVQAYDYNSGDSIFNRLIDESHRAGDETGEARAFFYRGFYMGYAPQTTASRVKYLLQANELCHRLGKKEEQITILTDVCWLYTPLNKLDSAYSMGMEALAIAKSIGYPYTHYITEALSWVGEVKGMFAEPLRYALETVRVAEASGDSIGWAYFYARMGNICRQENLQNREAEKWYRMALDRMERPGTSAAGLYVTLSELVDDLIALDSVNPASDLVKQIHDKFPPHLPLDKCVYFIALADCNTYLDRFDDAETNIHQADSMNAEMTRVSGYSFEGLEITMRKGILYFKKRDYQKARPYLATVFAAPSYLSGNILSPKLSAVACLIEIDSASGNLSSALRWAGIYKELVDSNNRLSSQRQAEELAVTSGLQEKENEIRLDQVNLKQATMLKNIAGGGAVLVLVIAALLYRQNDLRRRNNRLISGKNKALESLVREKEWLLKEVHHRVKNNLYNVICLLESQSEYLENDALKAIEISRHRIYAMSLIHQKLYQSEDTKTIDMGAYVCEFVEYLYESFGSPGNIYIRQSIQSLKLPVAQAVPLGLTINEAVTNALKYAFPGNTPGEISIGLKEAAGWVRLVVEDNGVGIREEIDEAETGSLGIKLMKGLAAELHGKIFIESCLGTAIRFSFPVDSFEMNFIALTQSSKLTPA